MPTPGRPGQSPRFTNGHQTQTIQQLVFLREIYLAEERSREHFEVMRPVLERRARRRNAPALAAGSSLSSEEDLALSLPPEARSMLRRNLEHLETLRRRRETVSSNLLASHARLLGLRHELSSSNAGSSSRSSNPSTGSIASEEVVGEEADFATTQSALW